MITIHEQRYTTSMNKVLNILITNALLNSDQYSATGCVFRPVYYFSLFYSVMETNIHEHGRWKGKYYILQWKSTHIKRMILQFLLRTLYDNNDRPYLFSL